MQELRGRTTWSFTSSIDVGAVACAIVTRKCHALMVRIFAGALRARTIQRARHCRRKTAMSVQVYCSERTVGKAPASPFLVAEWWIADKRFIGHTRISAITVQATAAKPNQLNSVV